ncbi:unnamed protein product, partial [Cuscuta epithymum]
MLSLLSLSKMEMEQMTPKILGKKLWKIVRIAVYVVKKGMSKRKLLLLDLQLALNITLKRGKHAGKALTDLIDQHLNLQAALTCRSDTSVAIVGPQQYYEFSCRNTPQAGAALFGKSKKHRRRNSRGYSSADDAEGSDGFRRALEIWNGGPAGDALSSPLVPEPVRQLRVTDSPFSESDESSGVQVDVDAEEFIKKFYSNLSEETMAAATSIESP